MADLSIASILIELCIAVLVGKHNQIIGKQKDTLLDIESKIDREFEQIENRINSLLRRFDEDIRETTNINYMMHQTLQEARININSLLSRNNEVLQDLKDVNINLLVASKLKLAQKSIGLENESSPTP